MYSFRPAKEQLKEAVLIKTIGVQLILLFPFLLFPLDLKGTAENGIPVILHDNGRWEYGTAKAGTDSGPAVKGPSFRGTQWGQDQSQISKIEKAAIIPESSTGDAPVYKVNVGGLNAFLIYYFTNNKLYKAAYVFDEKDFNFDAYIEDYTTIKKLVQKAYGEPKHDEILWENDLYKNDRRNWGTALSLGHLKYHAVWENDRTIVILSLYSNHSRIVMGLEYLSKELREEAKKNNEQKAIKDF